MFSSQIFNTLTPGGTVGGNQDANTYYNEMFGGINAQARIYPQALGLEGNMMSGLQGYQASTMGSQYQNLLGQYGNMQGGLNAAQGGYQGQLLGMYGAGGGQATAGAIGNLGYGGAQLYNQFLQQANEGLALGSSLTEQDTTVAQQSARAAMAARGLTGNQAVGQEVLNSYQLGNQRLQERQKMAAQAYQMASQQQQFGHQAYLMPAIQQSQGVYGLGQFYGATEKSFDTMGPRFLQPESQYLANIRGDRLQAENAAKAASAQKKAGTASAVGGFIGGLIGLCWVAREVYGEDNPKWKEFRSWMFTEAPEWFFNLYKEHGEEFAKFISDKPLIKKFVKFAMDKILEKSKENNKSILLNNG